MGVPNERNSFQEFHSIGSKRHTNIEFTTENISSGLISATLIMTGPAIILLEAASHGGFTDQQSISWMFAAYFFPGLYGILMSLWYRIPITGGHSLTGVAFLSTVTAHFTYPELIGGYVMSGVIIFLVGASGIFTRMIKWVPKEVIAAMLAGLVSGYVVRLVTGVKDLPMVGGAAVLSYLILMKFSKKIPPALGAVIIAILTLLCTQGIESQGLAHSFFIPTLQTPHFTFMGFVGVALPLAMLILSNDAAPGIGALESTGYRTPILTIVSSSGIFSLMTGFFGGHCANIAGMMTAICSGKDAGDATKRYVASLISGVAMLVFGIFSWKIVPFVQSLPHALISMMSGFALIGVLLSNIQLGFAGKNYSFSSLTTFIVALSNVSIFHISAPVWALLLGAIIAKTIEK